MKNVLILMLALPLLVLTVSCEKGVAADGDNLHGDVAGVAAHDELDLSELVGPPVAHVRGNAADFVGGLVAYAPLVVEGVGYGRGGVAGAPADLANAHLGVRHGPLQSLNIY